MVPSFINGSFILPHGMMHCIDYKEKQNLDKSNVFWQQMSSWQQKGEQIANHYYFIYLFVSLFVLPTSPFILPAILVW